MDLSPSFNYTGVLHKDSLGHSFAFISIKCVSDYYTGYYRFTFTTTTSTTTTMITTDVFTDEKNQMEELLMFTTTMMSSIPAYLIDVS